jgi:hypothetical protein
VHPTDPERTDLEERFANLSAFYFPDEDYSQIYEEVSNVNTFRIILSQYFGAKLEPLPDRSIFSSFDEPYRYLDVSERIRR